jgi:methyltransferase-like protein
LAQAEQAIDIIMGRTFRQSIMVKGNRHRQINRALTPAFFKNLYIQTRIFKKENEKKEIVYTHNRVGKLNAQAPYGTAALEVLTEAGSPTEFSKLAAKFEELSKGNADVFAELLFSLLGGSVIDIFADPVTPALPKGATPLALMDIAPGRNITTNAHGEIVALDPMQTLILPLLKGDWNRDEVVSKVEALWAKGAFNINPAPEKDQLKDLFGNLVDGTLAALKSVGIVG